MSRLTRRKQSWVFVEDKNGQWSVLHGERPVATGLSTQQACMSYLRSLHVGGERVYAASYEDEGYRIEITKQMAKLGVIDAPREGGPRAPTPAERWAALAANRRAARRLAEADPDCSDRSSAT